MGVAPGSMVGNNLRIERELGRGAMGTVWVAQNLTLGSELAVKVLQSVGDEHAQARFVQEARGLARIDSPHVVKVFDFGFTAEGEPYIVMELLRGEDLRARIERVGRLSLGDTAEVVTQICRALGRAHAASIIHRDIKPANVFLVEADGDIFVKLLDFGVAKYAETNLGMTATGSFMGTPYYASPEQLIDPRSLDHRSDLWAVGVVTYACLTATLPFQAEALGALSLAIHAGVFAPPSSHRPDLPPAVDAWMARALARDRAGRFGSAREMADALAAAVLGIGASTASAELQASAELPLKTVLLDSVPAATVAMETRPPAPVQLPAAPLDASLSPFSGTHAGRALATRRRSPWPILAALAAVVALAVTVLLLLRQSETEGDVAAAPPSAAAPSSFAASEAATAGAAEPAASEAVDDAPADAGAAASASATASATASPVRPPPPPTTRPPATPKPKSPFGTRH